MEQPQINIKNNTSNASGIASFIFGLISIFFLAPLFVPLAILMGIIAVINKQLVWGILGLFCASVGFLTSPILLGIAGIASISANHQSQQVNAIPQQHFQQYPYNKQKLELPKKLAAQTNTIIEDCKNKRLNGILKTYVDSAKCANPQIIEIYQHANYHYMDLIGLLTAKRLEVAEKIDNQELTEAQAQLELAEFTTQIADKERQRNQSRR